WPAKRLADGLLCRSPISPTAIPADDGLMETVTLPEVHQTGGLIGAEIRGLDLTREYPDETYRAIRRAWAEPGVIFSRAQHRAPQQGETFARGFGEIGGKRGLRREPAQPRAVGEGWHTDMTCFDDPPVATILFAQEVPPWGGDTQWAGMGPAFE